MKYLNPQRYLFTWVALLMLLALEGCSVTPARVYQAAETPEQKAFAVYGTFVVYEEQAAVLVQDERVPAGFKSWIKSADARAKPLVDAMLEAALTVEQVRSDFAKGVTTLDKLVIVSMELDKWINRAVPAVEALVHAVKGAK